MRLWRLTDGPLDTMRIVELERGHSTAPRRINVRIAAEGERADSVFIPFQLQGQRPAALMPANPPTLDPSRHLRGVRLTSDTAIFPLPFYEGIVVLSFNPRAGPLARQTVLDRLQGRVLAMRPTDRGVPEYIVQVGAVWRDSLHQRHFRRLEREVHHFGILMREEDSAYTAPHVTAVDSTVIDAHFSETCNDRADSESHRRLAMVFMYRPTMAERRQIERLFGAKWVPDSVGDFEDIFARYELVGTRQQVNRQLSYMHRLPQVHSARLNSYLSFGGGPVCAFDPPQR